MILALAVLVALAGDVNHGEILAGLGGCTACHTAEDGAPLAGGHEIETRFGTFYGSNISPHTEHGIGAWTLQEFSDAMRRGRHPTGRKYYPAFPYTSFTSMSDSDLGDLWAWLQVQDPVAEPSRPHDLKGISGTRLGLGLWRMLYFRPSRRPIENRGAYLVDVVGHCGECHTPRSAVGRVKRRLYLGGSDAEPEGGPNITPSGIGAWSRSDLLEFFESGMQPNGDFVGGQMRELIRHGTARLSADDRQAVVSWLRQCDAVGEPSTTDEDDDFDRW